MTYNKLSIVEKLLYLIIYNKLILIKNYHI